MLGRYRLGARLGAGGFGAVHEALDERLDRWVAVKVIPSAAPHRERARARGGRRRPARPPGIVALFDAGEDERRALPGLRARRRPHARRARGEGALTDRDVLRIGLALCDALEHAHERGVVHRDVKPQNVLVPDAPRSARRGQAGRLRRRPPGRRRRR